jgi:hypothetical protein
MDQLRSFPLGRHDDGPDALEMAVQAVNDPNYHVSACAFSGEIYYDSRFGGRPPDEYQPWNR